MTFAAALITGTLVINAPGAFHAEIPMRNMKVSNCRIPTVKGDAYVNGRWVEGAEATVKCGK